MVLATEDFDGWAKEQGMTLKVQKTLKLKFGEFNKQFVLVNRFKETLTEDKARDLRREELRAIKANVFLLWVDELNAKTMGLWFDSSKFSWQKDGLFQDMPRAVLMQIDRKSAEGAFEFKSEIQMRLDSRFNLTIKDRENPSIDGEWYLRLYSTFDLYRLVNPE